MFKKLAIMLSSLILLFMTAIIIIVLFFVNDTINKDLLAAYSLTADSIKTSFNTVIAPIHNLLLNKSVDENVQDSLNTLHYAPPNAFTDTTELTEAETQHDSNIDDILIYPLSSHNKIYERNSYGQYIYSPALMEEEWVKKTIENNGRVYGCIVRKSNGTYMRMAQLITSTENWTDKIGIVAADINFDTLLAQLGLSNARQSGHVLIVDNDGEVVYPYQLPHNIDLETIDQMPSDDYTINENYIVMPRNITLVNWHIVNFFAVEEFYKKTDELRNTIIVIGIFATALCIGIALIISYDNSKPLSTLVHHMNDDKYMSEIALSPNLTKEMRSLYKNYNNMVAHTKQLISHIYSMTRYEKELELNMLQAQINPHFLYNVFDSINWMALKYKANDISVMVKSLATMLRSSLNSGKNVLPIWQELAQVKSYLKIQSLRYGDSFDVIYDIDPSINNKKTIRLILQPLVENALIHGIETYEGRGKIIIAGREINGNIELIVKNNGNVIDLDRMNRIVSGQDTVTKSYGVRNINQRLKSAFGENYGLFYSIEGEWSIAKIVFPSRNKL